MTAPTVSDDVPGSASSTAPSAVLHKYGTRTRQNSVIRASARLRGSPTPHLRAIQPKTPVQVPSPLRTLSNESAPLSGSLTSFPPEGITLHPEDANNKVLLAIGRALLSVDNKAITIKDLSELVIQQGMQCQGPSAASQAITTYMRTHARRCEVEEDAPLLLKHTLSGTLADDDLAPALQSLTGGAQATITPSSNRRTNFRKGTTVWYLSRTAGASCPFVRAGIRICDYSEDGKRDQAAGFSSRERRDRDRTRRGARCGEKRKRLTRSCATKAEDEDSSADEQRAPKVKIILRLKPPLPTTSITSLPSAVTDAESSDDDSMTESSSEDEQDALVLPMASVDALQSVFPAPFDAAHDFTTGSYRRSPSVSPSTASAPPDSEDEMEQHIGVTGRRRSISADLSITEFDDTDDEMDWFHDQDDSADEADDEASHTGLLSTSPSKGLSSSLDAVARHLDQWEAMDHRVGEMASTPIEPYTAVPWIKPEDSTSAWTCDQHVVTSPSYSWGQASSPLSYGVKEETEETFSPLELSIDSPFGVHDAIQSSAQIDSGSYASMTKMPNHRRRSSSWQSAELVNTSELHADDFDDLPKSSVASASRLPSLSIPSSKSPMATVVPSPTHRTSPLSQTGSPSPWMDLPPSLSSSVSSSAVASAFDPTGSSFGMSSFGEMSSPIASRPPLPKQFSQATIRTLHMEPQTPWEYGLLSPADVDADFQTFFSTEEIKFPPEDQPIPDWIDPEFEVSQQFLAPGELPDTTDFNEFLSLPGAGDLHAVPITGGIDTDLDLLAPELLDQLTIDPELYATLTSGDTTTSSSSDASHSYLDAESSVTEVVSEPITPCSAPHRPEVESKPRRSTRLALQNAPVTQQTPKTPRLRSRAQSSR